jgi:ubiquinone/menaquinone biosynthesis C-methylase UbiE
MAPLPFLSFRKLRIESLPVVMSGVRMGERALQVGVSDVRLVGAIAAKVGLSGHAAVVVEQQADSEKAQRAGVSSGALIEVSVAPLDRLPYESASFDVVVVQPAGLSRPLADAEGFLGESFRVLRAGGRFVVIERSGRRQPAPGDAAKVLQALAAAGYKATRVLGEREGYRFVEGLKHQP